MILCVDPGVKVAGAAIFTLKGELIDAWLSRGDCWWTTADILMEQATTTVPMTQVVVERMQVYQGMPVPPEHLISLALMAGRVSALAKNPVTYLPSQWKGQVRKDIKVKRIRKSLSEQETYRVELPSEKSLAHNVWDAVGIGLHHLRVERRKNA